MNLGSRIRRVYKSDRRGKSVPPTSQGRLHSDTSLAIGGGCLLQSHLLEVWQQN